MMLKKMEGQALKSNRIKYVFIIIVLGLVVYAGYSIYGQNNKQENKPIEIPEEKIEMITNLRIPVISFDTINPILSKNQQIQDLARLIYEPLLELTTDGKIELCLAKEWTKQSPTSYVIKLRDNVKWQDGTLLSAKDVQFTFDRLKDTNINSIYAYNVEKVIGVEVIDDNTIKINLTQEVPFFEYQLTFPIMSYHYYENEDFINTSKNSKPIGTGRFQVENNDGNITLKQNKNWWKQEKEETKLEEIQIIKYQTMGEVYNAFKIGNIDVLTTNTLQLEDYIGTIGYNKKEYYGRNLDFLVFNCKNSILSDVEVRKAISYLINKQNIVEGIYKGKYIVTNFPLEYGSYLYDDKKVEHEYNHERARYILEQTGWTYYRKTWQRTKDYRTQRLRFDLVVNNSNENRIQVAENIKQTLSEFGIDITIRKVTEGQYQNYLQNKNYDMLLTGVYSGFSPDISYYFSGNNLANFQNDEMNQKLEEVKNIRDEKILKEKYKNIIEIYEQQMPYVFLYYSKTTLVCTPNLVGEINPNSYQVYQGIGSWYRQ
ncbi:MAG: peptide ABC transporter substrate-binding protein [Clostridia bacterium]|nr:peptide ABC transporter substrate-binding protein [Clostridia bacterium]